MRTKSIKTNKSKSVGSVLDTVKTHNKRLLIAIPSWTGVIDSLAVEGFMQLISNVAHLDIKIETYTAILKRLPIVTARNKIVNTAQEHNCDWILWIDDDMVVKPNINLIEKLLAHDKDIVAPLFFSRSYPFIPMLFKRHKKGDKFTVYDNMVDYDKEPKDKRGLIKVDGVGFGCVLTKVKIFDKITTPYFWSNEWFGEDLFFCEQATRAGFEIFVDTTVDVGHIGEPFASWEFMHTQAKEANYEFLKQKEVRDNESAAKFYEDTKFNVEKKVSVILTSYNKPEYIKLAIDSVLNQTYSNFELLIMDDNSDKAVRDIILSYKDDRIRTFFSDVTEENRYKNVRYSALINFAIDNLVTGDYITYMTDDDIYANNRLECMTIALNSHPSWQVVYSGQNQVIDNKVAKQFQSHLTRTVVGVCDDMSSKVDHNSFMHRKEILDDIRWEEDPKAWRWADAVFFKELTKRGIKGYPIDMQLDINIQHDRQVSRDIEMQTGFYKIDRSKLELP